MKLVLEIRVGPTAGRAFVIEPGDEVIVGRSAPSRLILDDPTISRRHFLIRRDGDQWRIQDLGSTHGTTINGVRVETALVTSGDLIGAGSTLLRARPAKAAPLGAAVIGAVPTSPPADGFATLSEGAAMIPESSPRGLILDLLRSQKRPLFAILDAARDPLVFLRIHECPDRKESLYEGERAAELAFVAPWLIELPHSSTFLERLVGEGWGESWGVFLTCDRPFVEVRKHLRRFLTVELEGGDNVLFRFYDPRVLRVFLPTCDPRQRAEFFGPISRYIAEGDDPDEALEFASAGDRPRRQSLFPAVAPSP